MVAHARDARRRALGGLLRAALGLVCVAASGCATIPPDAYGVERLRFHGVDALDDEALRACLATHERDPVRVDLGTSSDPTCDVPPFDGSRISLRLFHWPWTDWPTFDAAVFERDLDRVERWYRARGYYDATVERAEYVAEGAEPTDEVPTDDLPETGDPGCTRRDDGEGCVLSIDVHVHEGEPVLVQDIALRGIDSVPPRLRAPLRRAVELETGAPFDEALHDRTKASMLSTLRGAGHACATVRGEVEVDPEQHLANVRYTVEAGVVSRFRQVRVELTTDAQDLPLDTIRAAAGLEAGTIYAPEKVERARNDVYALGAFSSVEAEAVPVVAEGSTDRCSGEIDVVIRVTPGRRFRYGVGAGIDSGNANASTSGQTTSDARQWNVHMLARFEDRNFLGGIRRLRIEDRPKITFQDQFPNPGDTPRPGNEVTLEFGQPAFLERSTRLSVFLRHDIGIDPIYTQYRNVVDGHIEVRRRFVDNHISAAIGFNALAYLPIGDQLYDADGDPTTPQVGRPDTVARHALTFLSQTLTIDYRDNPGRPRSGVYFQLTMQQAGLAGLIGDADPRNPLMSWRYLRFEPDVRGFIPLPLGMVLAARMRLGSMVILDRYGYELADERSYRLGPTAYRMRAGGPSSNRGYAASGLADADASDLYGAIDGGLFKWEASLELRAAVTQDFGITLFADVADVNRAARFRFDQPHTALGLGIRYFTLVGPIRLDIAMLPRGLAAFGGAQDLSRSSPLFPNLRPNGVHGEWTITIGEAF